MTFLELVVKSELFQRQKDKYSKGATQKAINNTGLNNIKIPIFLDQTQLLPLFFVSLMTYCGTKI